MPLQLPRKTNVQRPTCVPNAKGQKNFPTAAETSKKFSAAPEGKSPQHCPKKFAPQNSGRRRKRRRRPGRQFCSIGQGRYTFGVARGVVLVGAGSSSPGMEPVQAAVLVARRIVEIPTS